MIYNELISLKPLCLCCPPAQSHPCSQTQWGWRGKMSLWCETDTETQQEGIVGVWRENSSGRKCGADATGLRTPLARPWSLTGVYTAMFWKYRNKTPISFILVKTSLFNNGQFHHLKTESNLVIQLLLPEFLEWVFYFSNTPTPTHDVGNES